MLNYRRLHYFWAVTKAGSFARAADLERCCRRSGATGRLSGRGASGRLPRL